MQKIRVMPVPSPLKYAIEVDRYKDVAIVAENRTTDCK